MTSHITTVKNRAIIRHLMLVPAVLCLSFQPLPTGADSVHEVINNGDVAGLKTLLTANPKAVNERNERGETPLHAAVITGDPELTRALLAADADVNARDHTLGGAPLMMAAMLGDRELTSILIAEGADADMASFHGSTALHLAAHEGHEEIVRLLLNIGANPELKNRNGLTPLDLAMHMGRQSVMTLMMAPSNSKYQATRAETRAVRILKKQVTEIEAKLRKTARENARAEAAIRRDLERALELKAKSTSQNDSTLNKITDDLAGLQTILDEQQNVTAGLQKESAQIRLALTNLNSRVILLQADTQDERELQVNDIQDLQAHTVVLTARLQKLAEELAYLAALTAAIPDPAKNDRNMLEYYPSDNQSAILDKL